MTELKTLKELDKCPSCNCKFGKHIEVGIVRQEAIKWIWGINQMIISDAKDLLIKIYEYYITIYEEISPKEIIKIGKMPPSQIAKALNYLNDIGAVNIVWVVGKNNGLQNFIFRSLTPIGINIIESRDLFKKTFNTSIGWIKR